MWTFWKSLRIFLILIALLGAIIFGIMDKNKQSTKMEINPVTKKEVALLPKLSGFIVDEIELIGSMEKSRVSRVLKEVQEKSPEKMRFVIYIRKGLSASEEFNYEFAKKLFETWDLKDTDVILMISIFEYSHGYEGRSTTWRLFKGGKVSHYFKENSTDPITFELRKAVKSGDYSGMFLSTTSLLLSKIRDLKEKSSS